MISFGSSAVTSSTVALMPCLVLKKVVGLHNTNHPALRAPLSHVRKIFPFKYYGKQHEKWLKFYFPKKTYTYEQKNPMLLINNWVGVKKELCKVATLQF